MNTIELHIYKTQVWDEVAKAAAYTGDKMIGDETAYERIMLTDEDAKVLQRFWEETVSVANDQLKEMLLNSSTVSGDYSVTLEVSRAYDVNLTPSVEASLRSYFISAIVSKWYMFANKGEAEAYATEALAMMNDVLRKLYSRKRPQRPKRN